MSGRTKVQQFGFSPQQLALRDARRIAEERVTGAIGLPAIVAGWARPGPIAVRELQGGARGQHHPAQHYLAKVIQRQLLPDFEPTRWLCALLILLLPALAGTAARAERKASAQQADVWFKDPLRPQASIPFPPGGRRRRGLAPGLGPTGWTCTSTALKPPARCRRSC
jgi:hypothetical protein